MEERYKLIEAYLADALPDDERKELERRMAEDESLRKEVELHRALQQEFKDPKGWQLYRTLRSITDGDNPNPASGKRKFGRLAALLLFALILSLGGGIWYYWTPKNSPQPSIAPPDAPSSTPVAPPDNPSEPPVQQIPVRPIAAARPEDFAKNESLEGMRSVRAFRALEITVPKDSSTVFMPEKSGKTLLRFSGFMDQVRPEALSRIQMSLSVFNNKDAQKPLLERALRFELDSTIANRAIFEERIQTGFSNGLYYYQIKRIDTGDLLRSERFYIGKH